MIPPPARPQAAGPTQSEREGAQPELACGRAPLLRSSLFRRSFLLIAGLVIACLLLMLQLIRVSEPAAAEQRLAWEVASVVNLTRSALVSAQPERRQRLLAELAREEGVRITPLEPGEHAAALEPPARARVLLAHLRALLGPATRLAGSVDGERGLWVSFDIDGDPYWLGLDAGRLERQAGPSWWVLALLAATIGLLGAFAIAAPLSRPLDRLAQALGRVSRGEPAPPLPERGPPEVRALNRRFNRMASALAALDADRAIALAGISHDIRSPLARLRLALEMAHLPVQDRASMSEDIDRIDEIVSQFIEYARAGGEARGERRREIALDAAIAAAIDRQRADPRAGPITVAVEVEPGLSWHGNPTDLDRMLANVLNNAIRHGRSPATGVAELAISARRDGPALRITVEDRGPGVPQGERERLLQPFTRLDTARGPSAGSGLGLAIVARLAQRDGGDCSLDAGLGGRGLRVTLRLGAG
jgi:two-component system osmolarity sensor histidine kinase EnvZ